MVGDRAVLAAKRGDGYVDLAVAAPDLPRELGALLRARPDVAAVQRAVDAAPAAALVDPRAPFAPPIADGAKILCLGLNYVDHAAEASYAKPEHPVVFTRFAQSFVGDRTPLEQPSVSTQLDYEAELVVVIGRGGRHIPLASALEHVAGYTLMNDGSVRDYQTRTPQWTLGKNFDRSGALGPDLVTADELPPGARGLALAGRVNGRTVQAANTSDMVFDVATTIAALSVALALEPGDLIAMGTPAGVGHARVPPLYLAPGDTFEVEIERVGVLHNPVAAERTSR
ncbi:MAG: fumarylacetoacetate hydrolase family protein [Deltaproteobacteria bacterium]|nr:fumarylacetoacetate hydrolase family protein [Deltaproteobacteria bacterium]